MVLGVLVEIGGVLVFGRFLESVRVGGLERRDLVLRDLGGFLRLIAAWAGGVSVLLHDLALVLVDCLRGLSGPLFLGQFVDTLPDLFPPLSLGLSLFPFVLFSCPFSGPFLFPSFLFSVIFLFLFF